MGVVLVESIHGPCRICFHISHLRISFAEMFLCEDILCGELCLLQITTCSWEVLIEREDLCAKSVESFDMFLKGWVFLEKNQFDFTRSYAAYAGRRT